MCDPSVRRGCKKIQADLKSGAYAYANGNMDSLFDAIAKSTGEMGGSSGGFTETFFNAVACKFHEMQGQDNDTSWKPAFIAGVNAVMEQGGASVGDRTMVDALKPAADALARENGTLALAMRAAKNGYKSTMSMAAGRFGRSANVRPESLVGQPDPGAYAVSVALEALFKSQQSSNDNT